MGGRPVVRINNKSAGARLTEADRDARHVLGLRIDGAQIGKHVGRTKGLTKNPLSCETTRGRVSRRRTNSSEASSLSFLPLPSFCLFLAGSFERGKLERVGLGTRQREREREREREKGRFSPAKREKIGR